MMPLRAAIASSTKFSTGQNRPSHARVPTYAHATNEDYKF